MRSGTDDRIWAALSPVALKTLFIKARSPAVAFRRAKPFLRKGHFRFDQGRQVLRLRSADHSPHRMLTPTARRAGRLAQLQRLLVRRDRMVLTAPRGDRYDAMVVGADATPLLVSERRDDVARWIAPATDVTTYAAVRHFLSIDVPAPPFRIGGTNQLIVEPLVAGEPALDVSLARQMDVCADLIRRQSLVVARWHEGEASADLTRRARLPRSICDLCGIAATTADGRSPNDVPECRCVPAHTDVWLGNILCAASRYWIIDWATDRVGFAPFWFDALSPIATSAIWPRDARRPDLVRAFITGRFDVELHALFRAADEPPARTREERIDVLRGWARVAKEVRPRRTVGSTRATPASDTAEEELVELCGEL